LLTAKGHASRVAPRLAAIRAEGQTQREQLAAQDEPMSDDVERLDVDDRPSLGPEIVADVFKVAAVLILCVATISVLVVGLSLRANAGHATEVELIIEGEGIITAGLLAFFAYVLDLLVSISDSAGVLSDIALADEDGDGS
jgi:hypothetical protein